MPRILFITTHNLATNPRLVKEIRLALDNHYQVSVICFEFNNWSKPMNDLLLQEMTGVQMIVLPAERKPVLNWLGSVVSEKISRLLGKAGIPLMGKILAQAVSRRSNLLLKALHKIDSADWVVGHNPGALFATFKAGQKFRANTGFDVEDYHPGEGNNPYLQELSRRLMKQVLPEMNYISCASPLIKEAVCKDLSAGMPDCFVVLNLFRSGEFFFTEKNNDPLKFVWFSQNITAGRGLEFVIPAIRKWQEKAELHLYGNEEESFSLPYLRELPNVFIHKPLPQAELHHALSRYDIGLALEPSKDKNNELAVSNKILAYMQAGLYVLATDTAAQETFMNNFKAHGNVCRQSAESAEAAIQLIIENADVIKNNYKTRYRQFININWETESHQLLKAWATV